MIFYTNKIIGKADMIMKKYTIPEIVWLSLDCEDVISTSSGFTYNQEGSDVDSIKFGNLK